MSPQSPDRVLVMKFCFKHPVKEIGILNLNINT
ncbi:hypothetical protein IFVP136_C210034 [Vibrio parahaemolyticus]